jgi:hypothetical protein
LLVVEHLDTNGRIGWRGMLARVAIPDEDPFPCVTIRNQAVTVGFIPLAELQGGGGGSGRCHDFNEGEKRKAAGGTGEQEWTAQDTTCHSNPPELLAFCPSPSD